MFVVCVMVTHAPMGTAVHWQVSCLPDVMTAMCCWPEKVARSGETQSSWLCLVRCRRVWPSWRSTPQLARVEWWVVELWRDRTAHLWSMRYLYPLQLIQMKSKWTLMLRIFSILNVYGYSTEVSIVLNFIVSTEWTPVFCCQAFDIVIQLIVSCIVRDGFHFCRVFSRSMNFIHDTYFICHSVLFGICKTLWPLASHWQ